MWSLRTDHGLELPWNAAEMRHRSLLAAWRLRARGLQPGDRLLTWSPSTPRLPALYWGAMRAGVVIVPLDLRMTPGVIDRISHRAETRWLVVDSGLDAPDPAEVGLIDFTVWKLEELVADPDDSFPADWQAQVEAWPQPDRDSLFEIVFTSGTTADPKGVHAQPRQHPRDAGRLRAAARAASHHRAVSYPAPLAPLRAGAGALLRHGHRCRGALRPLAQPARHRGGHARAARHGHGHDAPGPGALLDRSSTREVERRGQTARFERARRIARRLPYRLRRLVFRSVHAQFGGELAPARLGAAPTCRRSCSRPGRTWASSVVQGYGSTECGIVTANDQWHHPPGVVGRCGSRPSSSSTPRPRRSSSRAPTSPPATGATRRPRRPRATPTAGS